MKNETINQLIENLRQEMFKYWQKHRSTSGFLKEHEQKLYDSLCEYSDKEKQK